MRDPDGWQYEDKIVCDITTGMYRASRVRDGVRMYPYTQDETGLRTYIEENADPNPSPAPDLAAIEGRLSDWQDSVNGAVVAGPRFSELTEQIIERDIRALLDRVKELERENLTLRNFASGGSAAADVIIQQSERVRELEAENINLRSVISVGGVEFTSTEGEVQETPDFAGCLRECAREIRTAKTDNYLAEWLDEKADEIKSILKLGGSQ